MRFFYVLFLHLYHTGIFVASVGSRKARQWMQGRRMLFKEMEHAVQEDLHKGIDTPPLWLHCASLGEFEQSRSVLERIREEYPQKRILLTFFSPAGYRHCKDTSLADHVFYLPIPTPANVRRFLDLWNPGLVAFVRSEYWYTFMRALSDREVPMVVLSSIFRSRQYFFRFTGRWFRRQLHRISCFFVQEEASAELLNNHGIHQHVVCGDTRFDRVCSLSQNPEPIASISEFAGDSKVLVAGSTWPADEVLLKHLILDSSLQMKIIIAPHEIHESRIQQVEKLAPGKTVRYSQLQTDPPLDAGILILDTIGLLSRVYQYGHIAYVGGGFGHGIHNILEAATWGLPVFFGPNYKKFAEAKDLIVREGAQVVSGGNELHSHVSAILRDNRLHQRKAKICKDYVAEKSGVTDAVMKHLKIWL